MTPNTPLGRQAYTAPWVVAARLGCTVTVTTGTGVNASDSADTAFQVT